MSGARKFAIVLRCGVTFNWQRANLCSRDEQDNGYDNRVAGLDSPSQNRKNPPLRFIVLLSRVAGSYGLHVAIVDGLEVKW